MDQALAARKVRAELLAKNPLVLEVIALNSRTEFPRWYDAERILAAGGPRDCDAHYRGSTVFLSRGNA